MKIINLENSKREISKEELFSYALYSHSLISYTQEALGTNYPSNKLKIIKDHLYTKQNAAPNPKLRFKLVDITLDKAIALYIPKEGELKNNIFLITPFGTIKIATILSDDFDQETFKTALENLNLEQDEEYFFAQNDHLGKPIAYPATYEDINTSYLIYSASEALAKQFLITLEQIISESSHINNSHIKDLEIDATTNEGEFIDFFSIAETNHLSFEFQCTTTDTTTNESNFDLFNLESSKFYIPITTSQFIAWTTIPAALASIATYYYFKPGKTSYEPTEVKIVLDRMIAYLSAIESDYKNLMKNNNNLLEKNNQLEIELQQTKNNLAYMAQNREEACNNYMTDRLKTLPNGQELIELLLGLNQDVAHIV